MFTVKAHRTGSPTRRSIRPLKIVAVWSRQEAEAAGAVLIRGNQAFFETLMVGRTFVVVSHRLSTFFRADWIAVLHQGSAVNIGTRADGHYCQPCDALIKGMIPGSGAQSRPIRPPPPGQKAAGVRQILLVNATLTVSIMRTLLFGPIHQTVPVIGELSPVAQALQNSINLP